MPVPPQDDLCRFIDPKYWSQDDERPTAHAFSASKEQGSNTKTLSLWHKDRIVDMGSELKDLCIDSLTGFGEALITSEEILAASEECRSTVFQPRSVWRPLGAGIPWLAWKDAHVHIESERPSSDFPDDFRLFLAERCVVTRLPDRFSTSDPASGLDRP